jgi:hypothetical protein
MAMVTARAMAASRRVERGFMRGPPDELLFRPCGRRRAAKVTGVECGGPRARERGFLGLKDRAGGACMVAARFSYFYGAKDKPWLKNCNT